MKLYYVLTNQTFLIPKSVLHRKYVRYLHNTSPIVFTNLHVINELNPTPLTPLLAKLAHLSMLFIFHRPRVRVHVCHYCFKFSKFIKSSNYSL